jgi:enhancer of yellow 2 transcription factor
MDFEAVLAQVTPHAQGKMLGSDASNMLLTIMMTMPAALPMAVRKEIIGLIKRHVEKKFE